MSVAILEEEGGHFAFDSRVLIEMLSGTHLGTRVTESLTSEKISVHTSPINLAEAEYVLCKKLGHKKAREKVEALLSSAYISVRDEHAIHQIASRIKCERSIAFADCYTFAVAELMKARPVFAFREEELLLEMKKKPFEAEILFLT